MAMEWNWDNYMEFIEWLINNPESDKATILMIYWKSGPNENYKNRNIIEERYKNNFYKNQEIAFDPENDEGDNWVEAFANDTIPEIMFAKLKGKKVPLPENYIEGLPEKLFYEIESLYDQPTN